MMVERRVKGRAIAFGAPKFEERMTKIRMAHLESVDAAPSIDSPWFALRVAFGRELAVEKALRETKIEAFVPMRKGPKKMIRGRVRSEIHMPAVTGYVLVRFACTPQACSGILAVEHTIELVGAGGVPHPVSHKDVLRFKALADTGGLDWERVSALTFRRGERVMVGEGPFRMFSAVVISCRRDGKGDAVVELDLFGRPTPITMPLVFLEKL